MKFVKKLKEIKRMHVWLGILALTCVSILVTYAYAHQYIKSTFIQKLSSRGIDAEVDSVSLNSRVTLQNVTLKINGSDSVTSIYKISANYWLTDVNIFKAHVTGDVQDYLDLRSETKSKAKKSRKEMSVSFHNCSANLLFKGHEISAEEVSFSTSDSVVRAKRAGLSGMLIEDVSYSLKTNEARIKRLHERLNIVHKQSGIKNKSKPSDFKFPTLPDKNYKIFIERVGSKSDMDIRADNINIILETGDEFNVSVSGSNFAYIGNLYSSGPFELNAKGTKEKFFFSYNVKEPQFWHSKLSVDIYHLPMPVTFKNASISASVDFESPNTFSVTEGKIAVGNVKSKFSLSLLKGVPVKYSFSLPRTQCQDLMDANPFKSVFHKKCSDQLVDTGKCNFTEEESEDTTYSGVIEASVSGTMLLPKVGFYSTCKFDNVPWYLDVKRFQKPFKLRVGEPASRKVGDWKPRKEVSLGPGTDNWVPLNLVSYYIERALFVTEDGRFYSHNGVDPKAMGKLLTESVKSGEFIRGGSTITMQLAKNLWLMRDKTIDRKIQELFLTMYLESTMSKEQIMELYLNVIEFGPNVYGIYNGAQYYFKKVPFDLTLKESVFLASILPKPSVSYFSGGKLNPSTNTKLNYVLAEMLKRELITEQEMKQAQAKVLYKK